MPDLASKPMGLHDDETEDLSSKTMVRKICIFESEEHLVDFLDELKNHGPTQGA